METTQKNRKNGKGFVLFTLLFMALSAPLQANESSNWNITETECGACSVSFPHPPQVSHQSVPVSNTGDQLFYDVYLSPHETQGIFLLLVATYPFAFEEGQKEMGFQGLIRGIIGQHPQNELLFVKEKAISGEKGVEFLVQGEASYFRGQAVMRHNKLFLLAMEGNQNSYDESLFQKFVRSFHLASTP